MFFDKADQLLAEFQDFLGFTMPWGWFYTGMLNVVSGYPGGVTKSIILGELQNEWMKLELLQTRGNLRGSEALRTIVATDQIYVERILEVHLRSIIFDERMKTNLAVIEEALGGERPFKLKMLLHRKFHNVTEEVMSNEFKLRLTGCRVLNDRLRKSNILIPSEYFIIIIDNESMERMAPDYGTMQGLENCTEAQYIRNIKVKIVDIGVFECVHYKHSGKTLHRVVFTVVDDVGIQAELNFWDDYTIMTKSFAEGDVLLIKNCFLVPDLEKLYVLEHGPETVVYCRPFVRTKELVPSQTDSTKLLYVFKTDKDKLDYSLYPERLAMANVQQNMCGMILMGQVVDIGRKRVIHGIRGCTYAQLVKYNMKVRDDTGCCTVCVVDRFCNGVVVNRGQFVLMANLNFKDECTLQLDNNKKRSLWNVSATIGWLTAPSICEMSPLTSLNNNKNNDFFVVKAIIAGLKARNDSCLVRRHCSCDTKVDFCNIEQRMSCRKCEARGMAEMTPDGNFGRFKLEDFWRLEYDIRVVIMDSANFTLEVDITSKMAQELILTSPHKFQTYEKKRQQSYLARNNGKTALFGITNYDGQLLVGAAYVLQNS